MTATVFDVEERRGSLRRLLRQLRPLLDVLRGYLPSLAGTVTCGILSHALMIAVGAVGASMVGQVATGADRAQLEPQLLLLLGLVLAQAAAHFGDTYIAHVAAFRALADLRQRAYQAIERLAPAYTTGRRSGDLASVAMSDVELLELFFAHTIGPLLVAIVVPSLAVVAVGAVDPMLAATLLPFLLAIATIPSWLHRRGESQGAAEREATGGLAARLVDDVQGIREVLAFDAADHQIAGMTREGRHLQQVQVAHASRVGMEKAVTEGLVTLGTLAVLTVAGRLVGEGALDLALLPAVVVVAAGAFVPVTLLGQAAVEMGRIGAAAERLDVLLRATPAVTDRVDRGPARPLRPAVTFDEVGFRYAPGLPVAVDGVTFDIEPGETVALVGPSGAGKSTCASLLLRLWDVEEGAVRIGGRGHP